MTECRVNSLPYPACFHPSPKKVDCCFIVKLALAQDHLSHTKSKHITIGTGSNFTGECLVRKTNNQPEAYCLCPRLRYLRFPLTSKNGCCASCAPGAMATCWPYIFSCFVRVTRRQARLPTS